MTPPKNEHKRRAAVARIIAGQTTAATEAQVLGLSKRTLERMVADTRKAADDATKATPQTAAPSGATSAAPPTPAREAARKGAGLGGGGAAAGGGTPGDTQAAVLDMGKYCLDAINQVKSGAVSGLVAWKFSPPLELTDPKVIQTMSLSPLAEMAVRNNAPTLYPLIAKFMNGPFQLAGALLADGIFTLMALTTLAKSKGWVPAPKKPETAEAERRESFTVVDRAQQAPPPPPPVKPDMAATAEALKPGSADPVPGTYMGAPIVKPDWAA